MRANFKNSIFLITMITAFESHSEINAKNGSYIRNEVDFSVIENGQEFRFRRFYSSRLIYRGIFGYGWCSDFEKSIEIIDTSTISVKDCQLEHPMEFKLSRLGRSINASEFGSRDSPGLEQIFTSTQGEKILGTDFGFVRSTREGFLETFNKNGYLVKIQTAQNAFLTLEYKINGALEKALVMGVRPFFFHYSKQGFVDSVRLPYDVGITYKYRGSDLTQVVGTEPIKKYFYDNNHNLIKVENSKSKTENIKYIDKIDRVKEVTDFDGCTIKLIVKRIDSATKKYRSQIIRKCPKGSETKFNFQF